MGWMEEKPQFMKTNTITPKEKVLREVIEIKYNELAAATRAKLKLDSVFAEGVADSLGMSQSTFSRIKNGRGSPDFVNLARICSWLNVPIETFMSGQGRVVYYKDQDKLSVIVSLVNNDPEISEENRGRLINIFSVAYKLMSERKLKK